jgi:hypothetical protein
LEQYEKGKVRFAIKMAKTLSTIFHKTEKSTPILPALAERYGIRMRFRGHRALKNNRAIPKTRLPNGISDMTPGSDSSSMTYLSFDEYWNEIVYVGDRGSFTRKELIILAAKKLSGAHVDPRIDSKLQRIINSGDVVISSDSEDDELAITRAIYVTAYQVLGILNRLIPELEDKIPPPSS